jgi:hypothetical protein
MKILNIIHSSCILFKAIPDLDSVPIFRWSPIHSASLCLQTPAQNPSESYTKPMVSPPVCLVSGIHLGPTTKFFSFNYLYAVVGLLMWGSLYDKMSGP